MQNFDETNKRKLIPKLVYQFVISIKHEIYGQSYHSLIRILIITLFYLNFKYEILRPPSISELTPY